MVLREFHSKARGRAAAGAMAWPCPGFCMRPARAMPLLALPCGLRADRTCLALFFFLHLGRQTGPCRSDRISGTHPERRSRRVVPPRGRDQKKGEKNVAERNTTRKP
jgi:hypothetical protein